MLILIVVLVVMKHGMVRVLMVLVVVSVHGQGDGGGRQLHGRSAADRAAPQRLQRERRLPSERRRTDEHGLVRLLLR